VEKLMRQITHKTVAGRDLYICDNFVAPQTAEAIGQLLPRLPYRRLEKSRQDTPISGGMADIPPPAITGEPFFVEMRKIGEELFPKERFETERVYVNSSVYGDVYFPHRDCDAHLKNVTVLYYGNMAWQADWGGETIFYSDDGDAELAVSPRPNRVVVSRGGILHKGGVPARVCYEARYSIAYKLRAI
jgi:hypothetical protein